MADARRKPNLLLIGAPRCASSSLAIALERHPQIFLSTPKEPHFLAMHGRHDCVSGIGNDTFSAAHRLTHDQWLDIFAGRDEKWLLDASVTTISYPEIAIPNIRRYCDAQTKIIAILRNPVDRAFSSYQYCLSKGWDAGSFEDCLAREENRVSQRWQHLWFLRTLSRYDRMLQPFIDAFGMENVHVAITEEFAENPKEVLRGIFEFLDVPEMNVGTAPRVNISGVPKSGMVRKLLALVRRRPALRRILSALSPVSMREKVRTASLGRTEMSPETRLRLSAELAETKPWVEGLIGRPLTQWS